MKLNNLLYLLIRITAVVIMVQTLYFKFTGAEESVYIFSKLGFEPFGRYITGTFELIASILLFIPGLIWVGALMGNGLMSGAILSHFLFLGVEVMNDGGLLFFLAVTVWLCCAAILIYNINKIPYFQKLITR